MRNIRAAALALTIALAIPPASAAEPHPAVTPVASSQSLYTCSNGGLSRVTWAPNPAPCCTGSFGCPQLLSNTGLIKPKRDNRT